MLVVLDSNVLLSALISPIGPPGQLYKAWRAKRFILITCRTQIEEIRKASRYPHFRSTLQPHLIGALMNNLTRAQICAEPLPNLHTASDSTVSFLLNLTEVSHANYLVTGDKRSGLLEIRKVGCASILTARQFCEQILL